MDKIKSSRLKKGDTIGLVSNSAPLAGLVKHRTRRGISELRSLYFKVSLGRHALKVTGNTAGTPEKRAEDINHFFSEKKIVAIFSMIGGNHSNQIIDLLNYNNIRSNPKIIMGFSDTTVLLLAVYSQTNMVVFYGPSVLNQFAENPHILPYTLKYFRKATMTNKPVGRIFPSTEWTDEVLEWFKKEDNKRPRKLRKNSGWVWLKKGNARGKLIGGCITSMMHLIGTKYWPDFTNSLLFWEIPEGSSIYEGESVEKIRGYLSNLESVGVLSKIGGMIIGRPYRYAEKKEQQLRRIVLEQTAKYAFPILYNVDFGHTDPVITIPIGVEATINSESNSFEINENGVC